MTDRNYSVEMEQIIADMTTDDYVASELAAKVVAYLGESDRELLNGWLDTFSVALLTKHLSQRRRERTRASFDSPFKVAMAEHTGTETPQNSEPLKRFAAFSQYVPVANHVNRRVADLTKADCSFVANRYEKYATAAALEASFYRQLASMIPEGQKLSDVLTEEEFLNRRQLLFS